MTRQDDTTIVDLHRLSQPTQVTKVLGLARRVTDPQNPCDLLAGVDLMVGDTITLDPGAEVHLGPVVLLGGHRGRAHAFVARDAFASSPSTEDVPRLLRELSHLEEQLLEKLGEDPLALQSTPQTPFERAVARDFALQNLMLEAAQKLDPATAYAQHAVCLFFQGDSACVAADALSVSKIRALMRALGRPINPHLVDEATLLTLLERVYPGRGQGGGPLA